MTPAMSGLAPLEILKPHVEIDGEELRYTQRVLLELLRVVQDVHDMEDLQCLVFLADEFGILRPNPFCFGISVSRGLPLPWSLILRDTLLHLRASGLVRQDGQLRPSATYRPAPLSISFAPEGLAQLAALPAAERRTLARLALDLRFGDTGES